MKTQRLMQYILERGANGNRIPGQREDEESENKTLQWGTVGYRWGGFRSFLLFTDDSLPLNHIDWPESTSLLLNLIGHECLSYYRA